MPHKIFINYRRMDTAGWAHLFFDKLAEVYGDQVFFDRQSMKRGQLFPDQLEDAVKGCSLFFLVVGPDWDQTNSIKTRLLRKNNDKDWVLKEIGIALANHIPIIPVLVGGAGWPDTRNLPEKIAGVFQHHGLELDEDSGFWDGQLRELQDDIRSATGLSPAEDPDKPPSSVGDQQLKARHLSLLVNRDEQMDDDGPCLMRLLNREEPNKATVTACVISGLEEDEPHSLVERFAYFELGQGPKPVSLGWPPNNKSGDARFEYLINEIDKRDLLNTSNDAPLVLSYHVLPSYWDAGDAELINQCIEYWQTKTANRSATVHLFFRFEFMHAGGSPAGQSKPPGVETKMRAWAEMSRSDPDAAIVCLKELNTIERHHVSTWADNQCQHHCDNLDFSFLKREALKLFRDVAEYRYGELREGLRPVIERALDRAKGRMAAG